MKIKVSYEGKEYNLGFTKRTITQMESQGFDISLIDSRMVTMIPMFYRGAFDAYHPTASKTTRDEVWKAQRNKQGLLMALAECYNSVVMSLMSEPEVTEGDEGNETWAVVE